MHKIIRALVWAAAIITLAIANAMGLVSDDMAQTMFIVLPVVAWLNISGYRGCVPCQLVKAPQP